MSDIPAGWQLRRLGDVVTLPDGQVDPVRPPHSEKILIAPDHVERGSGRLLERRTAADQAASSGKYVVRPGDVIYSKIRPALRKAVIAEFDGLCSADMYAMTPSAEIDARYLLAVVLGDEFSRFAESVSGRSGIPKINRRQLEEFTVPLPPIDEQRQIAQTLSSFDSLIRDVTAIAAKLSLQRAGLTNDLLAGRVRAAGFGITSHANPLPSTPIDVSRRSNSWPAARQSLRRSGNDSPSSNNPSNA